MSLLLKRRAMMLSRPQSNQIILYDGNAEIGADLFQIGGTYASQTTCTSVFNPLYLDDADTTMRVVASAKGTGNRVSAVTAFRTKESLDLSGYSLLRFLVKSAELSSSSSYNIKFTTTMGVCDEENKDAYRLYNPSYLYDGAYSTTIENSLSQYLNNEVVSVDISAVKEGYVCGGLYSVREATASYGATSEIKILKIWLE